MKHLSYFIFTAVAVGILVGCVSPTRSIPPRKGTGQWQTNVFSKIGLEIQIPDWNAEIDDLSNSWTLFAFPLVDVPVVSDQYGVTIQVRKLKENDHRSYYPKYDGSVDLGKWMNSQQLQATQNCNPYWVWSRRDVFGNNGWAYFCSGQVKRVGDQWEFDKTARVGGDYRNLVADMQRIFESIRVVETNK
jgi:hypothetical protein